MLPPAARITSRRYFTSSETWWCHASLTSPQPWYGFLGHSNSWEEVVRKLHLSRTQTRKSRRLWDLETSVPELKWKVFIPHANYPSLRYRFIQETSNIQMQMGWNSVLLENVISGIYTFPDVHDVSWMNLYLNYGEIAWGMKTWHFRSGHRCLQIPKPATFSYGSSWNMQFTTSSEEFQWPNKPYHSCGELSDAWHSSSSLGWIQLQSRSRVRKSGTLWRNFSHYCPASPTTHSQLHIRPER